MSTDAVHSSDNTSRLRDYLELGKPSITFLAVFTALAGLWMAPGELTFSLVAYTVVGTAMVVAAANALNCYLERDSDRFMTRTRNRPLPAGRMAPNAALWFGCALALLSVPLLTFMVNPVTGLLAAIALVSYVWIYTPMKQISPKALVVGAIPGAMPPLLGWTALTGRIEWPGFVLFAIMFVWQMPHFIAITIYRREEYAQAGIKTVANVRSPKQVKIQMGLWTAVLIPVSLMLVPLNAAGIVYLAAASLLGLVFLKRSLAGLRMDEKDSARWARGVFGYSLLYIVLLFAALAVDAAFI